MYSSNPRKGRSVDKHRPIAAGHRIVASPACSSVTCFRLEKATKSIRSAYVETKLAHLLAANHNAEEALQHFSQALLYKHKSVLRLVLYYQSQPQPGSCQTRHERNANIFKGRKPCKPFLFTCSSKCRTTRMMGRKRRGKRRKWRKRRKKKRRRR